MPLNPIVCFCIKASLVIDSKTLGRFCLYQLYLNPLIYRVCHYENLGISFPTKDFDISSLKRRDYRSKGWKLL